MATLKRYNGSAWVTTEGTLKRHDGSSSWDTVKIFVDDTWVEDTAELIDETTTTTTTFDDPPTTSSTTTSTTGGW